MIPVKITSPGAAQQGNSYGVVDEHLHKVLPLHVRELGDEEGPVVAQLHHVVPPDLLTNR